MTRRKRIFDLALAALLIVLLGPLFVVLVVLLMLAGHRPLFYGSERMSTPTQAFTLWKLRTMRVNTGAETGVSGGDKTARITRIGRLLRRTRLDELPQIWNILRGDMSFVGPRPPLREYVERFPDIYGDVLKSPPGVTGLATLRFHRHEERLLANCTSAAETDAVYARRCVPRKAAIDLIYQRNQSMCYDLKLIGQTFSRLIPKS
ncbi:sugar transferase [Oceaniglobus indicus]|uniref:sugar transferase n=1 Tax=Oceaniglobus indicus TaxID=2047749 RepID=UPI000C17CFE1|nr:sugar transferase [Oceaniglobus indicus]